MMKTNLNLADQLKEEIAERYGLAPSQISLSVIVHGVESHILAEQIVEDYTLPGDSSKLHREHPEYDSTSYWVTNYNGGLDMTVRAKGLIPNA